MIIGCRGNKLTILTPLSSFLLLYLVKPVLIESWGCDRRLLYSSMSGARDVTVVTTQKFSVITPRMAPRKPEDDPYDCINMQQQPATDKGLVNAEMLAALPHKKEADPPQDTSAVYTFLGLATLPRLSKANPRLHEIPRELVTHIAEFAHRPEYRCYWLGTANSPGGPACKVDVTRHADVVLAMPPIRWGMAKTGAAPTTTRRHRRSTCNAAPQKAHGPITNTGAAASRSWSETSPTGRGCGGRRAFAFRGALSRAGPRAAGLPTRFSGRRRTR